MVLKSCNWWRSINQYIISCQEKNNKYYYIVDDRKIQGQPLKFVDDYNSLWRFDTMRPPPIGNHLILPENGSIGVICGVTEVDGVLRVKHHIPMVDVLKILQEVGRFYIPFYLDREAEPSLRQHTLGSTTPTWSVQGPTSLTHLSEKLRNQLSQIGANFVTVRLHIGRVDDVDAVLSQDIHKITLDTELVEVPESTAKAVNKGYAEGRPIIAWGTTAARAIESLADRNGFLHAGKCWTSLVITKRSHFRVVSALISSIQPWPTTVFAMQLALVGDELIHAYRKYASGLKSAELGDIVFLH
jgi:S-adenosylmethionine:tRNA ribosyltransferase-isomerase